MSMDDFLPKDDKLRFVMMEDMIAANQNGGSNKRTIIKREESVKVSGKQSIEVEDLSFPLKGPGEVVQFVLKAETKDFIFGIEIDGQTKIEDEYRDLVEVSDELTFLSAFDTESTQRDLSNTTIGEGDFSVVSIQAVNFTDNINMTLEPSRSVSINLNTLSLEVLVDR